MSLAPWLVPKLLEEYGLKAAETGALTESIGRVARRRGLDAEELCRIALQDSSVRREIAAGLTVGESYFFRHSEQEAAICGQVEQALSRGRRARIWSAGCARGEEPFTVGMLLIERFGRGVRAAVEIEATDVDDSSLECGRAGVYGPWSLRGMSESVRESHFERCSGGYRVKAELRSWIRFIHSSLQSQLLDIPTSSIDLVLFRNVGIYLTPEALSVIHEGIARVLAPQGLLLQAATDPPPPAGSQLARWEEGPFGSYRAQDRKKETPPVERAQKKSTRSRTALAAGSGNWPRMAKISGVLPVAAEEPAAAEKEEEPADNGPSITKASSLADAGRVKEAVVLVNQLIARHPRQRAAYVLRAQLRLHQHDCDGAVEDLRRALFLDPSDCLARYWYSVALAEAGRLTEAQAQRRVLSSHLAGRNGSDRLSDGETSVDDLRALLPDAAKELA